MRACAAVALFVLGACGGGSPLQSGTSNVTGSGSMPDLSVCGTIAADYDAALLDAMQCDPAAKDPCGSQYPLSVKSCDPAMNCRYERLCWVAYVGYVDPARSAHLDDLIARYKAAGCSIGFCPGPSPHTTQCAANRDGVFTCGGE